MGLFVKQDGGRSELQERIAADIAERQRAKAAGADKPTDGVEDSKYIEGTSHLSRTGLVLLIALVVIVIGIVVFVSTR